MKPFQKPKRCILLLAAVLGLACALGMVPAMAQGQAKAAATDPAPLKAIGSRGAPIIMEVFSDYECPACRVLYDQTLKQVMDNYVASGKVYLIQRDFPLPMHKHSREAARYANAAARIGKFEKVEDALFARQGAWAVSGDVDGAVATVLTPADMVKVRQMVRSGQLDAAIDKDRALGEGFRINQTPTTIITHRGQTYPVVGLVSYSILRGFLDQLLRQ